MENASPSKIALGSTQTTALKESTAPQHSPPQLPMQMVATEETTSTCFIAMREPQAKLGSLDHRHTSAVKAGTTVAVPAAVSTFDEYLDNFEEEMGSEEEGKEAKDKDKKEVEDDEVREDDEVVEDDEVEVMEHETTPHYNLRSSV